MMNKKMKILVSSIFALAVPVVIIPTVVSCSSTNTNDNQGIENFKVDRIANPRKEDLFKYEATSNSPAHQLISQEAFNSIKSGTNMFLDGSNQTSQYIITEYYSGNYVPRTENVKINTNWNLNYLNVQDNYISFAVSSYESFKSLDFYDKNNPTERSVINKFIPIIVTYKYNSSSISNNGLINNNGWSQCIYKGEMGRPGLPEIATDLNGYLSWYQSSYANVSSNWTSIDNTNTEKVKKLTITNEQAKQEYLNNPELNFDTKDENQDSWQKAWTKIDLN